VRRDGDEAETRGLVGEDAGDAGPAFEVRVDPFKVVGGADIENVSRTGTVSERRCYDEA